LRESHITRLGYPWLHVWQWRWQVFLRLAIRLKATFSTTFPLITLWSISLACKLLPSSWPAYDLALIVPSCFGLNMLTTLPLEAFVCREVMTNYWFPDEPWNPNRHLIFSTSLVFSAVMMSLLTCDLGAVFELIGATSACALAYILPPLCYIKLSTKSWKWIPAGICAAFGGVVMAISLVQAVAKIIRSK